MPLEYHDFTYPPDGGLWKLIAFGLLLPGIIGWFAAEAWIAQEAWWPGRRRSSIDAQGEAARAISIVYLSVASFLHFRWFWGMLGFHRVFLAGAVLSLLTFLIALLTAAATA